MPFTLLMATIFNIPELVLTVAFCLDGQADISALCRCCRSLHARDIEFSIYKVHSLATAMKRNRSFPGYCRSLKGTLNGEPQGRWSLAYKLEVNQNNPDVKSIREQILADVAYVLDQCLAHDNMCHLSWTLEGVGSQMGLSTVWIRTAFADWPRFIWSKKALQSLQYSVGYLRALNEDKEMVQNNLPNLSKLDLSITLERRQTPTLSRLLTCISDVRMLKLNIHVIDWFSGANDVYGTILPDTIFRRLESLSLTTNVEEREVCSDHFIASQPTLLELKDALYNRRLIGIRPTLKGLCIGNVDHILDESVTVDKLNVLSILRVRSNVDVSPEKWKALMQKLPQLSCIELPVFLHVRSDANDENACRTLSLFTNGYVIEFAVIIKIDCDDRLVRNKLTSTKRLDILLSCFSTVDTVRAFRIAYNVEEDESVRGRSKLPESHSLKATEIPRALEYILWEVPWTKRLYRVDRSGRTVRMIYTGSDRLPGRAFHDTLTWTNESIFDHIFPGPGNSEI